MLMRLIPFTILLSLAGCEPRVSHANENLRRHCATLGLELLGGSCSNRDSDHDGYVSCDANVKGQGIVAFECLWRQGGGCKQKAGKVQLGDVGNRAWKGH